MTYILEDEAEEVFLAANTLAKPMCTSREGLHCLEVINAAYRSLETKTWTKVGEK